MQLSKPTVNPGMKGSLTKPIVDRSTATRGVTDKFLSEATPLLFDDKGNFIGLITAYATSGNPNGLDIAAPSGTQIRYPIGGKVVKVEPEPGQPSHKRGEPNYGNYVIIEFKEGNDTYRIRIAHMKDVDVKEGDTIAPMQSVGTVGNTGQTYGVTGNHTDNTMWKNNQIFSGQEVKDYLEGKLEERFPQITEGFKSDLEDPAKREIYKKNYEKTIREIDSKAGEEIYGPTLGKKIATEAFGFAEGTMTGTGNLFKYLDPTYWFSELTGIGKDAPAFGKDIAGAAQDYASKQEQSMIDIGAINKPSEFSKVAGSLVPSTVAGLGATKYVEAAGGLPTVAKLTKSSPKLAKMLKFMSQSYAGTSAMTAGTEGRMPSAKEAGVYGMIDMFLGGLGVAGSKLYQSAFKTTAKTAEKYQKYGTTLGKVAEKDLGKAGTAEGLKIKSQQAIDTVKKGIESTAKGEGGVVTKKQFKKVAEDAAEVATKDMYASKAKDFLYKKTKDAIMDYAPKKTATYSDIVRVLPKINASIFLESGAKSASHAAEAAGKTKRALKEFLPESVTSQYPKYEGMIDINRLMKKRTLPTNAGFSIASVGKIPIAGGLIGGSTGFSQGGVPGMLAGGLMGTIIPKLAASTAVKTYGGQVLKKLPVVSTVMKGVTQNIIQSSPILQALFNRLR